MNNLQKEVICFINKNNNRELHFNFYDNENNLVGYIYVDELGNMSWQIINLMYKDYLTNVISYIFADDAQNMISYKTKAPNEMSWIRSRVFIENQGLVINYNYSPSDYDEVRSFIR